MTTTSPAVTPASAPEPSVATLASSPSHAPNRVLSIDLLRGLTIAFMILVNDAGDSRHTYTQLEHARWNGLTLTDLVFPTFLFLVGASTILSLSTRLARGDSRRTLALRVIRRAATIFLIDLLIAASPFFHLTQLRIYGVLTRIALCYLVVGLLTLVVNRISTLFTIAVSLLVGYWLLMRFVPIPGLGHPVRDFPLLDPYSNLTAWIDRGVNAFFQRTLHTGRLYEGTRDPEGLLSTLPSIATTIAGSISALWLRRLQPQSTALRGLLFGALLCLLTGRLWGATFPINKNLWTSSYALFAAGCSLGGLALFYWLVDIKRLHERSHVLRAALWPLLVFGSNAITAYAISAIFEKTLFLIKVHDPASPSPSHLSTLWGWLYFHVFARGNSTELSSLAFALAFVALCFLPNLLLWKKRIFLKV